MNKPVLAQLVQSGPVQRLRGIHQAGASHYIHPDRRTNTRFDHSAGVMYVLTALGATIEERVAGLLHDIPHTAFSHTVDLVFPNDEHNFHEGFQHDIVMNSEIPAILAAAGIDLRAALQPGDYRLLEQLLPNLCADRIDYTLRDVCVQGKVTTDEAHEFVRHLNPTQEGILINDTGIALWFAWLFKQANDTLWAGPDEAGGYWTLAQAIKRAYAIGEFTDEYLFSDDTTAMAKLTSSQDEVIHAYLNMLQPGLSFHEVVGRGPFFESQMKDRAIDPLVLETGWASPKRLSSLSAEYAGSLNGNAGSRVARYRLWSDSIPEVVRKELGFA